MMKINNFRGGLPDVSAKTATLAVTELQAHERGGGRRLRRTGPEAVKVFSKF